MSQSPFVSAGNANNGFQNGGMTASLGQRARFVQKDDGTKPVLNAGNIKVPNIVQSNRTIVIHGS
jgi:hypothetical protein